MVYPAFKLPIQFQEAVVLCRQNLVFHQLAFTCSKLTVQVPEQCLKFVQSWQ